jgi:tetratricopeptide (TPR) repeat protein
MKTIIACAVLLSLLLASPVLSQDIHRINASGDIPLNAATQQSQDMIDQGEDFLKAGNYRAAEQVFRASSALAASGVPGFSPSAERGLAEALTAQGKTAEALQLYQNLIYQYPRNFSSVAQEMRTQMRCAILLSQTGHWKEAVSIYEKALPSAVYHGMPKLDVHFDPQSPMPVQLQAIAHVACGIELSGHGDNPQAFKEYEKGSYLAPDSALVNYYFGDGWQQLSPAEQAKFGRAAQAKAALQKAVRLGKGPVKKAAQKVLRMAMKLK